MEGFHKGMVRNSYQAACDTSMHGPLFEAPYLKDLGFALSLSSHDNLFVNLSVSLSISLETYSLPILRFLFLG